MARVLNPMANITVERGACTAPFLQMSKFDGTAGCKNSISIITTQNLAKTSTDLNGRFCAPVPSAEGTVQCCLPCPITDWVYSDGERRTGMLMHMLWSTEGVLRLRHYTESCELAQCRGHGMLRVDAYYLPCLAGVED